MIIADIKRTYPDMHGAERRVADFILAHPKRVTQMSMAELSAETETSDATVMRVCRRINQSGFYQLKINLATQTADLSIAEASGGADGAPEDVVTLVDTIAANVSQLSKDITMEQISDCVELLAGANTVFTFGWGNMAAVADDFAHRLLCYGIDTFTSASMEYLMRRLILADEHDVIVVFSRSGESIYTIECCRIARRNGVKVIAVTGDDRSTTARLANVVIKTRPVSDVIDCGWGSASHVYELVAADILLYFLRDRCPVHDMDTRSEAVLSQFKN
ncbi:MurR/RpiR family transcriptional regulator [Bifidobacterium samirii]|uniref:RpiR family transcriptional regulator n=1 Tax=Bifidobacterium samirii TaxID=2306974 RepID=A0A430FP91_9BIFI|nr:MurR/RpiR family transcriptional regulator [Bifidobacterium samirii]RSX54649.1 RpiR family transcriptional regulator [Bifidobacterium samirii]